MIKEEGNNKMITELRVRKLKRNAYNQASPINFINVNLLFQSSFTNKKMAQTMESDGSANLQNRLLQDEEMGSMVGLDCQ